MMQEHDYPEENTSSNTPPICEEENTVSKTVEDSLEEKFEELFAAMDKLDKMKQDHEADMKKLQESKQKFLKILKWFGCLLVLAVTLVFYREMGQAGWNCFCCIAAVLGNKPEELCGLLVFLGAALLLFELAKWTFRAAAEDLLGDNSDLYDEIIPFSTK